MTVTETQDLHFYEPAKGHGLKHDPFNAIIAPRPIGWISSRSAAGHVNLAPYSFFNGFNYTPPIIGFSSTSRKDSVANIEETGEFVWNLATMDLAQQMIALSGRKSIDVEITGLRPGEKLTEALLDETERALPCAPKVRLPLCGCLFGPRINQVDIDAAEMLLRNREGIEAF
eukprot:gene55442-75971_t